MLTKAEIETLIPVIDAGIRATGLQVLKEPGAGARLDDIIVKLQLMAQADASKEAKDVDSPDQG